MKKSVARNTYHSKMKKSKNIAHKERMAQRTYTKGLTAGLELALLGAYSALTDKFKFTTDDVNKFNYEFQKNCLYIISGTVSRDDLQAVMEKNGVDLSVIGDDNIDRIEKLKGVIL